MNSNLSQLPGWAYLYEGALGSGVLKSTPEDFYVEEDLGYSAEGEGEHLRITLRKRGLNSEEVARRLSDFMQVERADVGYAGMKDRHAVTLQSYSVKYPMAETAPDLTSLQNDQLQIVSVERQRRKIKKGELAGNRFRILLRDLAADHDMLEDRLHSISAEGVPNYFGPQRFGINGQNIEAARQMLSRKSYVSDKHLRSLYLSTARALLFNDYLSMRLSDGVWNRLVEGDCIWTAEDRRGTIIELQSEKTKEYLQQPLLFQITGPLYGNGREQVRHQALEYERLISERESEMVMGLIKAKVNLQRRPLRLMPEDLEWGIGEDKSLTLEFYLSAGSYATSVIRELINT